MRHLQYSLKPRLPVPNFVSQLWRKSPSSVRQSGMESLDSRLRLQLIGIRDKFGGVDGILSIALMLLPSLNRLLLLLRAACWSLQSLPRTSPSSRGTAGCTTVYIQNCLLRPGVSFLYAKHHSEMNATSALIAARDLVLPPRPVLTTKQTHYSAVASSCDRAGTWWLWTQFSWS